MTEGAIHLLVGFLTLACSLSLTLFVYANRLYNERGRFLIRESRTNAEFFEEHIDPKLGIRDERLVWTYPLLVQTNLVVLTMLVATWNLREPFGLILVLQKLALLLMIIVFFGQVIPYVLMTRTEGRWVLQWTSVLRVSIRIIFPLVLVIEFLHHIASLGRATEEEKQKSQSEQVEALMQAGEDEGLLEKDDRRLIQSVVEFGDKTVREVMTPRQEIFAVPAETSLGALKKMLGERRFSRIPVYEGDLDHIICFLHSGDLFAVEETELEKRTVQELARPVEYVPETKPISELLQELQKSPKIAIVIDEYGAVAGLVTVEDMVEEIVGEIRDEHEEMDVIAVAEGQFSVPGGLDLDRLEEIFDVRLEDMREATTVSGLVTESLGRVPVVGEFLERDHLNFEVTESNGRRVTRLLVSGPVRETLRTTLPAGKETGGGVPEPPK
jgi:putative hemolysin